MLVSAIVPAFNEEKKIRNVLNVLTNSKDIDEVICVNDGSTDNTASIVKKIRGVKILSFPKNYGKAHAIAEGILRAKGDIVVFIDADLVGLKAESIHTLVIPLKTNKCDVVIGYRCGNVDKFAFKPLSGERAYFKKDLLPLIEKIKGKGFGLELYLNYAFKDKNVKLFALKGVLHTLKQRKYPLNQAIRLSIIEVKDLFSEVFRQKNPFSYFVYSYLRSFYIKNGKRPS